MRKACAAHKYRYPFSRHFFKRIQGRAGAFVMSLQGSYPAVVGLPLYETLNLLTGLGYVKP